MTEELYQSEDVTKLAGDVFAGKLTVEEALKRLRTRLLDLSIRNRLLNYKHPKGRSIQFVGSPDLDLLYERLKEDKKEAGPVSVAYIPEPHPDSYGSGKKPEARHHAASLGYPTIEELLEAAAARKNRSLTNMLETLVFAHCEQHGLQASPAKARQIKAAGK